MTKMCALINLLSLIAITIFSEHPANNNNNNNNKHSRLRSQLKLYIPHLKHNPLRNYTLYTISTRLTILN